MESKPAGQPAVHCGHTLKVIQMIITRVPGLTGCVQAHNCLSKQARDLSKYKPARTCKPHARHDDTTELKERLAEGWWGKTRC